MNNIVVSGNGVPAAANSRTASGTTRQNSLSGGNVSKQGGMTAVNQKANEAYNAWRTVTTNQSAAVSVDIPEGAMRVSREIQEEYGAYPGSQIAYAQQDSELQNTSQNNGNYYVGDKASGAKNSDAVTSEEVNPKDAPIEEEASKKGKTYGITEEGLNNLERLLEEMKESRKTNSNSNSGAKKRLNYNYRRISSTISRAKNVNQASNALTTANSNLNTLRRKMASGKFNENDVQIAINHAKKMVRVARKKVKHIKWEMQVDKQDTHVETDKEHRNHRELVVHRENLSERKNEQERELLMLKKQLKQLRVQRKSANRRNEDHDLIIADMEYLRKKLDLLRQEHEENRSDIMKSIVVESSAPVAEEAAAASAQIGGTAEAPTAAEVADVAGDSGAVVMSDSAS